MIRVPHRSLPILTLASEIEFVCSLKRIQKAVSIIIFTEMRVMRVLALLNRTNNQKLNSMLWCTGVKVFLVEIHCHRYFHTYLCVSRNACWRKKSVTYLNFSSVDLHGHSIRMLSFTIHTSHWVLCVIDI